MSRQRLAISLLGIFLGLAAAQPGVAADRGSVTRSLPREQVCDRACLYDHLDRYLDALKDKDPSRLPWAQGARTSENNVELMIGDGLWGTITGLGDYELKFADPSTGQVGFFGAVEETGAVSPFVVRLAIEDGRIAEVETLVRRAADQPIMAEPTFVPKPVLNEVMPEQDRLRRERLISIADGYFDTLQLNDGTLFTHFDAQCNRVENGVQTTNNPQLAAKLSESLAMGCEQQFKMGYFRYDDRLRGRRFPLVDVERGLVLAAGFIDHAGRLGTYKLSNGKVEESRYRRPHSYYLLELFNINKEGKIRQIEAVFMNVPYHMPSPWDQ